MYKNILKRSGHINVWMYCVMSKLWKKHNCYCQRAKTEKLDFWPHFLNKGLYSHCSDIMWMVYFECLLGCLDGRLPSWSESSNVLIFSTQTSIKYSSINMICTPMMPYASFASIVLWILHQIYIQKIRLHFMNICEDKDIVFIMICIYECGTIYLIIRL